MSKPWPIYLLPTNHCFHHRAVCCSLSFILLKMLHRFREMERQICPTRHL